MGERPEGVAQGKPQQMANHSAQAQESQAAQEVASDE